MIGGLRMSISKLRLRICRPSKWKKFGASRFSCGYCGYALNSSSSTRNAANIGSKYGKQIRKGVISFYAIDESRFAQTDEVSCTILPLRVFLGFLQEEVTVALPQVQRLYRKRLRGRGLHLI